MDISLLRQLAEARGVSGNEAEVRDLLARVVRPKVDGLRADTMGNLIAYKKGTSDHKMVVMLASHMDEVGLMVVGADSSGYLRFQPVGGIDPRVLPAKRVLVGKDRLPGVIGVKPVHLTSPSERQNVLKVEDLYIDIGAKNKDEALTAAALGESVSFDTPFTCLQGCTGDGMAPRGRVSAKALDDRAGCFVLASLLDMAFPCDLYAVFTVQEEIGMRGARTAAYTINPTVAFALEGTVCDDAPREEDLSPTTRMSAGPAITVADASFIADRRLVTLLTDAGDACGIPYQLKQPNIGGTDSGAIHLQREGIPSAAVGVPCRYIHSPESVMDLSDLDNTIRLMQAALTRLPETWA
jgi:putative aminopeptidase FrvX